MFQRNAPVIRCLLTRAAGCAVCLLFVVPAAAQESGRGGPSGDRMFMYMDRDRNGSLDAREIEQMPGPMRTLLQSNGQDGSRSISREEFLKAAPQMMMQFRGGPSGSDRGGSDGGESDRGRSGYGGYDRGRGGFGYDRSRSSGDGDRSDGDRDRGGFGSFRFGGGGFTMRMSSGGDGGRESDRDSRSESSKSSSQSSRQRVTLDLPEEYQERDLDLDGQIGQYEWMLNSSRAALAEFQELDANGDGFLTPRELMGAKESNSSGTVQSSSRNGGSRLVIVRSGGTTSPSDGGSSAASDAATRQAETFFGYLDRDKDGKLVPEEWATSRRLRPMFEQAGIDLSKPMSREQFVQHSVRLSQNN